jgi:glycosyltransferase involved in cell wall biosynthesis
MNKLLGERICGFASFLKEKCDHNNQPVFDLNGRKPNFTERMLIRFRMLKYDSQKTMRRELFESINSAKPDILMIHYASTARYLWDVINRFPIPVYIYVHGYDIIWDHNDDTGKKFYDSEYMSEVLNISKKSNVTFIANSECSFQNLLEIGIEKNKIVKKIFGVNLPAVKRNYRKNEMTVLFLGRLVDYKGPDIVIKAFIKACESGFEGRLIVAGDGFLKEACERIASNSVFSNRIDFMGEVDKKQAENLYLEADLYSMHNCRGPISNGYDTFGVTVIEALSYGLPVVTGKMGGPAEIIENGTDGILVEPFDVKEHADAFLRLFRDRNLCEQMGNNGRNKILNKYSADIEKSSLFNILKISGN